MAKHTDGGSLFDFLDPPPDPAPKAEPPQVDPPVESLPPSVLVSTPALPPTDNIPVENTPSQPAPEPSSLPETPPVVPEVVNPPIISEVIDLPVTSQASPEAVDLPVDGSNSPDPIDIPSPIDVPPVTIAEDLPVVEIVQPITPLPIAPEPEISLPATPAAPISPPPAPNGNWWTIPLICLGICMIAVPMLISQADQNRRLNYERFKLERDLKHIETQISVNEEFLKRIAADPTLAERLAQRQMKMVREGTSILELKGQSQKPEDMSPFLLVTVPPPPPLAPYHPVGGFLASLFRHPRAELFSMGIGFLLIAAGLILGPTPKNPAGTPEESSDL